MEAHARHQRAPRVGALRGGGPDQRVVRDGGGGQDGQAVGPGVGGAEDHAYRAHQPRAGHRCERQAPLHVHRRRGQARQVLGPRDQHGHPPLPRAPQRCVLLRAASDARHLVHGGQGLERAGVGHAQQKPDLLPRGTQGHRRHPRVPGHGPADHFGLPGLDGAAVGPRGRQGLLHPHAPQEERPQRLHAPHKVPLRVGLERQHQAVAVSRRGVHEERGDAEGHRQLRHGQPRRRPRRGLRQRLHAVVRLAHRLQLPDRADTRPARELGERSWDLRHDIRHDGHASHHVRGRQDDQGLQGGRDCHPRDPPRRVAGLGAGAGEALVVIGI
mmetsp:Transcript_20407/g.50149  ORF Transcript_20407/g.50149 Transcript_20407/m.50149 type:complete len:328 (+) Transcript_20407:478-1461(+)